MLLFERACIQVSVGLPWCSPEMEVVGRQQRDGGHLSAMAALPAWSESWREGKDRQREWRREGGSKGGSGGGREGILDEHRHGLGSPCDAAEYRS